jgi:3-deoxy-D-manno-octulosonate 8-phosphate phosphatase (KDO 8-P phosphatase)
LLLLDVDGVLTDGRIIIDDRGVETKQFHVRDGQGIALLISAGIEVGFMTARSSPSVRHRARELGVRLVRQQVNNKLETYNDIKRVRGLADKQIAYMGDDLIDLPTLKRAGLAATVSDAPKEVRSVVDVVMSERGGCGAVRGLAELLLRAQGKWNKVVSKFI